MQEVTPADVQAKWDRKENVRFVDVREVWEWEASHIPGALLLPLSEFTARYRGELNPDEVIICICAHGIRSERAAQYLFEQGYERVATMTGGMSCYTGTVEGQQI